jgi:hypothetical protein
MNTKRVIRTTTVNPKGEAHGMEREISPKSMGPNFLKPDLLIGFPSTVTSEGIVTFQTLITLVLVVCIKKKCD